MREEAVTVFRDVRNVASDEGHDLLKITDGPLDTAVLVPRYSFVLFFV